MAAHSQDASRRQGRAEEARHRGGTLCESLYSSSKIGKTHPWGQKPSQWLPSGGTD